MHSARVILLAGLALAPGTWFTTARRPVAAQQARDSGPMEITTDTPEYCLYLRDRVHNLVHLASSPPPKEVTDLSREGQRMCDQGQTRGGIMRLRRALTLMLHDSGSTQ